MNIPRGRTSREPPRVAPQCFIARRRSINTPSCLARLICSSSAGRTDHISRLITVAWCARLSEAAVRRAPPLRSSILRRGHVAPSSRVFSSSERSCSNRRTLVQTAHTPPHTRQRAHTTPAHPHARARDKLRFRVFVQKGCCFGAHSSVFSCSRRVVTKFQRHKLRGTFLSVIAESRTPNRNPNPNQSGLN